MNIELSTWGIIGICVYTIAVAFSFVSYGFSLLLYLTIGLALFLFMWIQSDTPLDWIKWITTQFLILTQDPWSGGYITALILALHFSFKLIESSFGFEKPVIAWGVDVGLFVLLTIAAIEYGSTQLLNVSVVTQIIEWIQGTPPPATAVAEPPPPVPQEEVFHISGRKYTYEDAQNLCRVYGAKLATYDQIEQSYQNGGEWCEYGWSDHQSAYFPAQRSTWNLLKNIPGSENACGRPGVNGGYIDDPRAIFGVNCYGIKPARPESGSGSGTSTAEGEDTIAPETTKEQQARLTELAGPNGHSLSWFNFDKWSFRSGA